MTAPMTTPTADPTTNPMAAPMAAPTTAASRSRTPLSSVQGTLALDLAEGLALPDPPRATPLPAAGPADVVPIDRRLRREIDAWAPRFTQAAVEIAVAERPPQQLLRWTTPQVYRDLERRGRLAARARQRDASPGVRPRVLSTHPCVVGAAAVEVSAHVRHGQRSRAVAARFERRAERWVCTALEFA